MDQSSRLIFPDPEKYVRIITEFDAIRFEKVENVAGWRLNFSVDIWPSEDLSRKYSQSYNLNIKHLSFNYFSGRGIQNLTYLPVNDSYEVEPNTEYTVRIETDLGMGVRHHELFRDVRIPPNYSALPYQFAGVSSV